jgi:SAM-dependent methyltransferase
VTRSSILPKEKIGASVARRLGPEDAAIFETFVVPRYLAFFGERLLSMIAAGDDARVCHLQCRTGYPDRALVERLPNVHVHGCDVSEHAIELARAKAATLNKENSGVVFDYGVAEGVPSSFPPGAFSHAFTIHPLAAPAERKVLFEDLARLLAPHGQALVAMPLRGSFVGLADLLRECALKYELVDLANAVEASAQLRPTDEAVKRELEVAGFEYVEVDVRMRTLKFSGGRAFFEDPAVRLLIMPELCAELALEASSRRSVDPLAYVRDAIDKYWSDSTFEVTVNVGVVSGRRRAT